MWENAAKPQPKPVNLHGLRLPCQGTTGVSPWLSKDVRDLRVASRACAQCPRRIECLDAAIEGKERWGIWGGVLIFKGRIAREYSTPLQHPNGKGGRLPKAMLEAKRPVFRTSLRFIPFRHLNKLRDMPKDLSRQLG